MQKSQQEMNSQCNSEVLQVNLISESGGCVADSLRIFEKSLPGIAALGAIFKGDNKKSIIALIPIDEIPGLIKFLSEAYDKSKNDGE